MGSAFYVQLLYQWYGISRRVAGNLQRMCNLSSILSSLTAVHPYPFNSCLQWNWIDQTSFVATIFARSFHDHVLRRNSLFLDQYAAYLNAFSVYIPCYWWKISIGPHGPDRYWRIRRYAGWLLTWVMVVIFVVLLQCQKQKRREYYKPVMLDWAEVISDLIGIHHMHAILLS